jgi:hypothetical protein
VAKAVKRLDGRTRRGLFEDLQLKSQILACRQIAPGFSAPLKSAQKRFLIGEGFPIIGMPEE